MAYNVAGRRRRSQRFAPSPRSDPKQRVRRASRDR